MPSTPIGRSRTSQPWQYGQCRKSRPQRSRAPSICGQLVGRRRSPAAPGAPRRRGRSARPQREAGRRVDDAVVDELDAVARDLVLGPRASSSAGGVPSRERKPCMCAAGALRGVAGVDDDHAAAGAAEHERGAEARRRRRRRSRRHRVRCPCVAACDAAAVAGKGSLPFPGIASSVGRMASGRRSRTCWREVGPRLRRLRERRGADADGAGRADRDLQEHAVAAGERRAQAQPRAAAAAGRGATTCRWTSSSARRGSATRASGSRPQDPQRPARLPADAAVERAWPCGRS